MRNTWTRRTRTWEALGLLALVALATALGQAWRESRPRLDYDGPLPMVDGVAVGWERARVEAVLGEPFQLAGDSVHAELGYAFGATTVHLDSGGRVFNVRGQSLQQSGQPLIQAGDSARRVTA